MRRYPGNQIEYGGEGEDLARDTGRRKLVEKGGGISFPPEIDWCEFRDSTAGCLGTQESQAQTDPTKTLACQEPRPTGALCLGQGYCRHHAYSLLLPQTPHPATSWMSLPHPWAVGSPRLLLICL